MVERGVARGGRGEGASPRQFFPLGSFSLYVSPHCKKHSGGLKDGITEVGSLVSKRISLHIKLFNLFFVGE